MIKKLVLVFIALFAIQSYAQQGTASPYSFYGIGSLKFKGTVESRNRRLWLINLMTMLAAIVRFLSFYASLVSLNALDKWPSLSLRARPQNFLWRHNATVALCYNCIVKPDQFSRKALNPIKR